MSPEAIHGTSGFYVPCEELPAELPPLPPGAIVGQAAGFVAKDEVAAALPTTPYGAIRGSQVGFVAKECGVDGVPFPLSKVWQVGHLTGVQMDEIPLGERLRDSMPIFLGVGWLGQFSRWDQLNDPPLEFDEIRYFMRFTPPAGPPPAPAIRYRVSGVVRPTGSIPGLAYAWEVRAWDWETVTAVSGSIWDEGTVVHQGIYVMPDDTVWSPSNPIGMLVTFEFPAIEPDRCWIGWRNTSLTGEWAEFPGFSERPRALGGESLLASNGATTGYVASWTCIPIHAAP